MKYEGSIWEDLACFLYCIMVRVFFPLGIGALFFAVIALSEGKWITALLAISIIPVMIVFGALLGRFTNPYRKRYPDWKP